MKKLHIRCVVSWIKCSKIHQACIFPTDARKAFYHWSTLNGHQATDRQQVIRSAGTEFRRSLVFSVRGERFQPWKEIRRCVKTLRDRSRECASSDEYEWTHEAKKRFSSKGARGHKSRKSCLITAEQRFQGWRVVFSHSKNTAGAFGASWGGGRGVNRQRVTAQSLFTPRHIKRSPASLLSVFNAVSLSYGLLYI